MSDGAPIFQNDEEIADKPDALKALERLKELAGVVPPECFELNPIAVCEAMTQTDDFAYCPFIYGYSNYSRPGYARKILEFGGVVSVTPGAAPSTMLGGTGLAISAKCNNLSAAIEYLKFRYRSGNTTRTLFHIRWAIRVIVPRG